MRDFEELKEKEKDEKKKKVADDKSKAEEIRRAVMEGIASMFECCHALNVF